jgi:hypothetical protein
MSFDSSAIVLVGSKYTKLLIIPRLAVFGHERALGSYHLALAVTQRKLDICLTFLTLLHQSQDSTLALC